MIVCRGLDGAILLPSVSAMFPFAAGKADILYLVFHLVTRTAVVHRPPPGAKGTNSALPRQARVPATEGTSAHEKKGERGANHFYARCGKQLIERLNVEGFSIKGDKRCSVSKGMCGEWFND